MRLKLDSRKDSESYLGVGHSKHYEWIAQGLATPLIKIGQRSYRPAHENEALIRARIAGKSDDEIKALVAELVAARQAKP